jgi:hypothetical protein
LRERGQAAGEIVEIPAQLLEGEAALDIHPWRHSRNVPILLQKHFEHSVARH